MFWGEMLALLRLTLEKVKGVSPWRRANKDALPFICKEKASECSSARGPVWALG